MFFVFAYVFNALCAIPFLVLVFLLTILIANLDCIINERSSPVLCFNLCTGLIKFLPRGNSTHVYLYYSCVTLLLAYFFVPMGSLPAYVHLPFDALLLVVLLCSAQGFYVRGVKHYSQEIHQKLDETEHFALSRFCVAFVAVGICFAWFFLDRGVPGRILSLENIAAMVLWQLMGVPGRVGLACFLFLLAFTSPSRGNDDSVQFYEETPQLGFYDALRANICPVVIVSTFLPWNPAISLGLHGYAMFSLDFAFFWCKVLVLQILIVRRLSRYYLRIRQKLPDNIKFAVGVGLYLIGLTLVLVDLGW